MTTSLDVPSAAAATPTSLVGDFRESVADVWAHRELLVQLAKRDIKLRYKQSVMGFAWAILMPLMVVFAGLVVRLAMAYVGGQPLSSSAMGGVVVKALPWAFFVGAVGFASTTLVGNANLVSKVFFPREVLPLAALLTQSFDTLVGAAALTLVIPLMGARLSFALLWIVPLSALFFLLTTAICLFLACSNLFFRDVKYLVQVFLTFGIFFTPVFFDASMLGQRWGPLLMLNPIAPLLEGFRVAVMRGHNLLYPLQIVEKGKLVELWIPGSLLWSTACALVGVLLATATFRRLQYLFAEYI